MKLWMSGEIQLEAYDAYRQARAYIEKTVNEALSSEEFGESVKKLAYIAIIGAPAEYEEVAKYSKRTAVLEFRLVVPIEQFIAASRSGQIEMICESLKRCAEMSEGLVPKEFDTSRFRSAFLHALDCSRVLSSNHLL